MKGEWATARPLRPFHHPPVRRRLRIFYRVRDGSGNPHPLPGVPVDDDPISQRLSKLDSSAICTTHATMERRCEGDHLDLHLVFRLPYLSHFWVSEAGADTESEPVRVLGCVSVTRSGHCHRAAPAASGEVVPGTDAGHENHQPSDHNCAYLGVPGRRTKILLSLNRKSRVVPWSTTHCHGVQLQCQRDDLPLLRRTPDVQGFRGIHLTILTFTV